MAVLKREQLTKDIVAGLSHLRATMETLAGIGFFDANVASEDFFRDMLNLVFGYSLVNLNHETPNHAAIDLGDQGKRLCFQVTSERRLAKIRRTLDGFLAHKLERTYDRLKVLIIGKRTGEYKALKNYRGLRFTPAEDIIDIPALAKRIAALPTETLDRVRALCRAEISGFGTPPATGHLSDKDALAEYRSFFDRPALHDSWCVERNPNAFAVALDDLIALLNTGRVKGQHVTKRRADFTDPELRSILDSVYHTVRDLRARYTGLVRSGVIIPEMRRCQPKEERPCDTIDAGKQAVIDELNTALTRVGIKPLRGVQASKGVGRAK